MTGASAGAAAAAAARRRREQEEEQAMTRYTEVDLAEGWEFKILRSATGQFRLPDRLRQALDEESRAGWVLVEKFDNQRVRLKRPISARARDSAGGAGGAGAPGFDPYRTTYGMSEKRMALMIAASIIGVFVLAALIAFIATR